MPQEMNKFDHMMALLKFRLRQDFTEAPLTAAGKWNRGDWHEETHRPIGECPRNINQGWVLQGNPNAGVHSIYYHIKKYLFYEHILLHECAMDISRWIIKQIK